MPDWKKIRARSGPGRRLHRVLSTLKRLQDYQFSGVCVSVLAREFDISTRQALRDLHALNEAGFPLVTEGTGPGIRWKLLSDSTGKKNT